MQVQRDKNPSRRRFARCGIAEKYKSDLFRERGALGASKNGAKDHNSDLLDWTSNNINITRTQLTILHHIPRKSCAAFRQDHG